MKKELKSNRKNRGYFLALFKLIRKTELSTQFERDLPELLSTKLEEILQEASLTIGYKKLVCQEFLFMIKSLNKYKETGDEEASLRFIYWRGRSTIHSKTEKSYEKVVQFDKGVYWSQGNTIGILKKKKNA